MLLKHVYDAADFSKFNTILPLCIPSKVLVISSLTSTSSHSVITCAGWSQFKLTAFTVIPNAMDMEQAKKVTIKVVDFRWLE
jgi:hypothetical protein